MVALAQYSIPTIQMHAYVVIPKYGVGQIDKIANHSVANVSCKIVSIKLLHGQVRIQIPFDNLTTFQVRTLSSPKIIRQTLAVLAEQKNTKHSNAVLADYLQTGSPLLWAKIIRQIAHQHQKQELSYTEHNLYSEALERLAHEMCLVLTVSYEEAKEKIAHALRSKPLINIEPASQYAL